MPAYARDDQIICHFQSADKFKTRHAAPGFSDKAHLGDGVLRPAAFALTEWTEVVEAKIGALVKQAVS
jgi:hypothetical protein